MKQGQQHIEQRDHRGQTSLNKGLQAMGDPLETTDHGHQGKRGLHRHAVIPGAFGAQLAVVRHAVLPAKSVVGQHDAASTELLDERMKLVVRDIHRVPIPIDDLPKAVENPTELDTNAPAPFVFGLFAKLLCAAPLPNGKQQLDWETVNHQEKAGIGQEPLVPILMRDQQALQSGAIGQPGKQGFIISDRANDKRLGSGLPSARTTSRS